MQLPRRVVVTGMGLISPLGNSVKESWSNCINGCSGISDNIVDLEDMPIKVGGRIRDFDPTQYIDSKDIRRLDTFVQYGVSAGIQAIEDAGLDNNIDKDSIEKYMNKANSDYVSSIYKSYDKFVNTKYKININEKVLERLKNSF